MTMTVKCFLSILTSKHKTSILAATKEIDSLMLHSSSTSVVAERLFLKMTDLPNGLTQTSSPKPYAADVDCCATIALFSGADPRFK